MAANSAAVAPAAPTGGVAFPWWVNLIAGISMAILGLLLLAAPAATTVVLIQFLGIYWLVDGIVRLVSLFINRSGWGWKLCMGILGILAGLAVLQHPLWATLIVPATVILIVGIFGIVMGIFEVVAAFRGAGWGTGVLGAISIVLGLMIIMNPLPSTIALPFVLGCFAVAGGILAVVSAVGSRVRRQA